MVARTCDPSMRRIRNSWTQRAADFCELETSQRRAVKPRLKNKIKEDKNKSQRSSQSALATERTGGLRVVHETVSTHKRSIPFLRHISTLPVVSCCLGRWAHIIFYHDRKFSCNSAVRSGDVERERDSASPLLSGKPSEGSEQRSLRCDLCRRSLLRITRKGHCSKQRPRPRGDCTSCAKGKLLGLGDSLKAELGEFLMELVCSVMKGDNVLCG